MADVPLGGIAPVYTPCAHCVHVCAARPRHAHGMLKKVLVLFRGEIGGGSLFTPPSPIYFKMKRLLAMLYAPQHFYLIHVDSRCAMLAQTRIFRCRCLLASDALIPTRPLVGTDAHFSVSLSRRPHSHPPTYRSNYMYDRLSSHVQQFPNVKMTSWRLATIWGSSNLYEVQPLLRWAQYIQRTPCSSFRPLPHHTTDISARHCRPSALSVGLLYQRERQRSTPSVCHYCVCEGRGAYFVGPLPFLTLSFAFFFQPGGRADRLSQSCKRGESVISSCLCWQTGALYQEARLGAVGDARHKSSSSSPRLFFCL